MIYETGKRELKESVSMCLSHVTVRVLFVDKMLTIDIQSD